MVTSIRQGRSDDNYYETTDYYYGNYGSNDTNSSYPNYYDDYGQTGNFYYKAFDFEEPVYIYVWIPLIILTTLMNILVLLVLRHRRMRSATNTILIFIAITDSLTGLVTVPGLIYAFTHRVRNDLELTRDWCNAFMLLRYFVSRSFHTISIWLTVLLGLQRMISVMFPFKAQSIFSTRNTIITIVGITAIAPFVHIYHVFDSKTIEDDMASFCQWTIETPCQETCAYFWISVILMHFLPCGLLVVFTASMIGQMKEASKRMQESKMITNQKNIDRRNMESRRITIIVLAVVVVFLIPEVPYGVFLLVTAVYRQMSKPLLEKARNREIICAYEILLVLSFQANFWIYVIMNRKFRRGLKLLLDPVLALLNCIRGRAGMEPISRPRLDSTTASGGNVPIIASNSNTVHCRLSISHSFHQDPRRLSRTSSGPRTPTGLEMRTYSFSTNNNQMMLPEMENIESESEHEHTDKL